MSRRRIAKRLHRIARVKQQRARRDLESARAGVRQVEDHLASLEAQQEQGELAMGEPRTAGDLQLMAMGRIGHYVKRSKARVLLAQADMACETRQVEHSAALVTERNQERVWERVRDDWRREVAKEEQKDMDELASQRHEADRDKLRDR